MLGSKSSAKMISSCLKTISTRVAFSARRLPVRIKIGMLRKRLLSRKKTPAK